MINIETKEKHYKKPKYEVVYYYILLILRTHRLPIVSFLVLITAFFVEEKLKDVFDLILIFLLFFNVDFLMPYTKIRTSWVIRFVGALIGELVIINIILYFDFHRKFFYFLGIFGLSEVILFIAFILVSTVILSNDINWSGSSQLSQVYRKSIREAQNKDPTILSKYFSGRFGLISSFVHLEKLDIISSVASICFLQYTLAGLYLWFFTRISEGLLSWAVDDKLVRFAIFFLIVFVDIWNSYKENQYKKLEKSEQFEKDPFLSFIDTVFLSKRPYFYLTLTIFNFLLIFIAIFMSGRVLYSLIKTGFIGNTLLLIFTEETIITDLPFSYNFILFSSVLLIFIVYLLAHRIILDNFARRQNNLKPLNYQKYQEALIFFSISYLSLILILIKNIVISQYFFMIFSLPIMFFPILFVLSYKSDNKIPLTNDREHIIWLAVLPSSIIIGGIKMVIVIILFFIFMLILTLIWKFFYALNNPKKRFILLKKNLILVFMLSLLAYIFLGLKDIIFILLFVMLL